MPDPATNTPGAQSSAGVDRPPRFSDARRAALVKAAYLLDLTRR
jgi:hypothetical protein